MWTPLANAAQSGADSPPPTSVAEGWACQRDATRRAISGAGSTIAATAQPIVSSSRRFDSRTTSVRKVLEAGREGEIHQAFSEVTHGPVGSGPSGGARTNLIPRLTCSQPRDPVPQSSIGVIARVLCFEDQMA